MASSWLARGFRTFQVFTKNKNIFRKCSLPKNVRCVNMYRNPSSNRCHQASNPARTAAMIGLFGAAGGNLVVDEKEKERIKAAILSLIEKGKCEKEKGQVNNSSFEAAQDKANRAYNLGKISQEERDIIIVIANKLMGENFLENGVIDRAEFCFVKAMESYKNLGINKYDDASLELILRLTNCFTLSGREVEAKDSFDMIIDIQLRKIQDSTTMCSLSTYQILWATLQLYGRFLVLKKDYDEAESMLLIADDVMQKASGELFNGRQDILTDLAGVKIVKQDMAGAEATFEKAIRIGEEGNAPDVCFTYCYMADLATRMDNFHKAAKMCDNGLRLATKLGDNECLKKANLYSEELKEARTNGSKPKVEV